MQLSKIIEQLKEKYDPKVERVGFILKNGEIVEVENVCPEPEEGFDVKGEDILKYGEDAYATWHTHPTSDCNLSMNDYETFLNWPELEHFIVGTDGVRRYIIEDGEVLIGS
jgi:Predicted metal-dependent protease of the PAD1/JAB1 superfamily